MTNFKSPITASLMKAALCMCSVFCVQGASAQVYYTGTQLSNPNHHDGQLSPVVGVHNIQIMRANREHPSAENGSDGHTTTSR